MKRLSILLLTLVLLCGPAFAQADSSALTAEDYLGHWVLARAVFYDTDITETTPDIGVRSYTITPDGAIDHWLDASQGDDGNWIYEPVDTRCTWSLQPDGSILVEGNVRPITLLRAGDYLIGTDGLMTTWYIRNDATSTQSSAGTTAEDYLGYWQVIKVEMDGVDITADALAFGDQGVTFNEDGAMLHGQEIAYNNGETTITPTLSTAAWVFQPDGSMEVLQSGQPLTFRHDGEYLRVEDQGIVFTYARAQAPGDSSALPIESVDCLGRWKLVKLTAEGMEIPDELLATVEFTMTFEADHAIVHMASLVSAGDAASPEAYTFTCAWHVGTSGVTVSDNTSGINFTLQPSGEYLLADMDGAQFVFAREAASTTGQSGVSSASASSAERSAFLSVFTHPATEQDKELVLVSAYAADKAYQADDVKDYLVSLGFPEERIRQYDYTCDAAHYAAVTLASREVTDAQGCTATLYALVVRGTKETAEWISNFDMGNGDVALGFYQAALRALDHFTNTYMALYPPVDGADPLVWVTGHSRGAAVANLIAGQFLTLPAERVYAVTFATPNVARSTTRATNILNFVIDGDVVTAVPFQSWGFDRHGLTVHYTDDALAGIALTSPKDLKILVDFLSQIPQTEYYEMTLEVLHGEVIAARNTVTLPDMLTISAVAVASRTLDHADQTLATGGGVIGDVLFNTAFQPHMRLLLGDLLPNEQQATLDVIWRVIDNAVPCHTMSTYIRWIECIYYDRPTNSTAPGSSGGGSSW